MDLNRVIEHLLSVVVERKASDLFITAGWPPSVKIDGAIYPATKHPLSAEQSHDMVLGLMNDRQREEFRATNECRFVIDRPRLGRFRVSAFVQREATDRMIDGVSRVHDEAHRGRRP